MTYFRILKHAPESILLRSVLGGITRYGHLISVDYFDDLLAVIRHILANNFDDLSLTEALYCVVTVLTLFSGQGERLMAMDLNYFYAFAYRLLMEAPARLHDGRDARNDLDEADEEHEAQASFDDEESTVRLITKCMQLIFFKRGKNDLSATRAAAFIKRLLILTTVMESPASILALLECVRTLVARAPSKVHQILDTEENRVGDAGAYAPELDDPEMCHPFAAGTWELAILAQHWHPAVRQWVQDCCRGLFKQLLENQGNSTAAANAIVRAASPKQILSQYAIRGGCAFNPSLATLKRKPKKKVEGSKQLEPLCRRAMPLVSGEPMEVQKTECADISEKDLMSALRQLREVQELDQKRSSLRLLRRQSSFMRGYFKA